MYDRSTGTLSEFEIGVQGLQGDGHRYLDARECRIRVRPSALMSHGAESMYRLFAAERLRKGDCLGVYAGEIFNHVSSIEGLVRESVYSLLSSTAFADVARTVQGITDSLVLAQRPIGLTSTITMVRTVCLPPIRRLTLCFSDRLWSVRKQHAISQ